MREPDRETSAGLRAGEQECPELLVLTRKAQEEPTCRFTSLMHLLDEEFLGESLEQLESNRAPGVDDVSVQEYESRREENLKDLVERMKSLSYRPRPVRRAEIPKLSGGTRELGLPTVEDKMVQMGMKRVLEPIYEVDFLDCSYGFRPGRSCHDALGALQETICKRPMNVVIDADIKSFFDEVDHEWMMEFLRHRIADSRLLRYVKRFLKAGVMQEGGRVPGKEGTPQGGVLSPLLANVYLHYVLDLWFEKVVKKHLRGDGELVRYADDFVILLERKDDAERVYEALSKRLEKFGLRLSASKSQMIDFGRREWNRTQREGTAMATFDFLGLTHYGKRGRNGRFQLGRKTARSRMSRALRSVGDWLKRAVYALAPEELVGLLNRKLIGHYRYFGVGGNFRSLKRLYYEVTQRLFKTINRRSQRRSYTWEQFKRFLEYNPLAKPKIYHSYAQLATRGGKDS